MDISDIETAIVDALGLALIGNSFSPEVPAPSTIMQTSTVVDDTPLAFMGTPLTDTVETPVTIKLYRGWPTPSDLDADIAANTVNVSVFPLAGMTRILSSYQRDWIVPVTAYPTITLTIAGNLVTVAGNATPGQVVGIAVGSTSRSMIGYAYRVLRGDTLAMIASSLAAIIPGASVNGTVITLVPSPIMTVGVAADQTAYQEMRRQDQDFLVTIWSPGAQVRDTVASTIDQTMMEIDRLNVGGIVTGPIRYRSSKTEDEFQEASIWRRDLTYTIEYPTTIKQAQPTILFPYHTVGIECTDKTIVTIGPRYPGT